MWERPFAKRGVDATRVGAVKQLRSLRDRVDEANSFWLRLELIDGSESHGCRVWQRRLVGLYQVLLEFEGRSGYSTLLS